MGACNCAAVCLVVTNLDGDLGFIAAPAVGVNRKDCYPVYRIPPVYIWLDLVRAVRVAAVKAVLKAIRKHPEGGLVIPFVNQ